MPSQPLIALSGSDSILICRDPRADRTLVVTERGAKVGRRSAARRDKEGFGAGGEGMVAAALGVGIEDGQGVDHLGARCVEESRLWPYATALAEDSM